MKTTKLRIAKDFTLPLDAVTETFGILAKRGVGKTHTSVVMAEEMLKAGAHIVIADPVGVWWGLRSSRDGTKSGFPIIILGGDHGDIPLESTAGAIIADLVIGERVSVLLDLSLFSKNEQRRFVTDFAERLYRKNRDPLHLFLDEADEFAPQRPLPGEQRMLGAVESVVRRGRARGLGVTLITQRSAVLNKDVLTQVEILVAMRTIAPQDRSVIDAWIKYHGTPEDREQVISSLASLPVGTAWIWSPGWLNVLKKVAIRQRETFDSSATPKIGQAKLKPRVLADVDLDALSQRMVETIEKAQAENPKELRKRIHELERLVKKPEKVKHDVEYVNKPVFNTKDVDRIVRVAEKLAQLQDRMAQAQQVIVTEIGLLLDEIKRVQAKTPKGIKTTWEEEQQPEKKRPTLDMQIRRGDISNGLTGPEQRIIDAIAWSEAIGVPEPEQVAAAFLAGYRYGGGAFNNPRGQLKKKGLVSYHSKKIRLTDTGKAVANIPNSPATVEELHHRVLSRLSGPESRLLQPLLKTWPKSIQVEELARRADYAYGSGAFNNPKGRLRTLGLINYPEPGYIVASDILFP